MGLKGGRQQSRVQGDGGCPRARGRVCRRETRVLGCPGGVAMRKAGVQCTAWRGTAGESWGSGRSARADMAGGHSEHANDAALDQVASASALGAIKQQAMSSAATLVKTARAEPWPSPLS